MQTNLLVAFTNLIKNPVTELVSHYSSSIRINNMGDALEFYVKDLLCDSLNEKNLAKKNDAYHKYFSYIGNQNNPPDIIIRGGDAIEVKKIEGLRSVIALNSSYPKDKIYSDNPMITQACRDCEDWRTKDLIYIVGVVKKNSLRALWFVYGDCYAAGREVYERIREKISAGINELPDVEFSQTNELGRVNKVDPLGVTYLRIRGMWGIENPVKVFDYIVKVGSKAEPSVNAIMLKEKYLSFPEESRRNVENLIGSNFEIRDIKIKSPNNPAVFLDAKLLSFRK